MKICPKCGRVISFNSYFGAFICDSCNWEDRRVGERRNRGIIIIKGKLEAINKVASKAPGTGKQLACK